MTTVAVVIPTHNRPELLAVAVGSVLSQQLPADVTVRPVIVDDASDPPAAEALGELADAVVIVRNDTPRGPAAARNQGASAIDADLVAFLDDDDRWLPGKVQACLSAFNAYPDAALVFHQVAFDWGRHNGAPRMRVVPNPVGRMLHRQPPHIDGVVVPSQVHKSVRFDESFLAAEDLDYLLRLATSGRVVELSSVLAVLGTPAEFPSAISIASRIAGRRRFREKHAVLFDRKAKAYSDLRIGHQYRHLGSKGSAAGAFALAMVRKPLWAAPWKGLLGLALSDRQVARIARSLQRWRPGQPPTAD
jgi:glycosyltransferase involved in cell wall biosynthesis